MFDYFRKRREAKEAKEQAEHEATHRELEALATEKAKKLFDAMIADKKDKKLRDEEKRKAEEKRKLEEDKEEKRLADIALKEYIRKKKESDVPWMEMMQEELTADGAKITMDWNDAQIKFLRANGYTDPNDEVIIHQYLSAISKDLTLTELARDYVESSGDELIFPERGDFTEEDKELDEYVREEDES